MSDTATNKAGRRKVVRVYEMTIGSNYAKGTVGYDDPAARDLFYIEAYNKANAKRRLLKRYPTAERITCDLEFVGVTPNMDVDGELEDLGFEYIMLNGKAWRNGKVAQ